MKTVFQGSDEIVVHAGPERIWAILEDSTLLSRWAPMVKSTTGKTERVGSVRECQVEWSGRRDMVSERCIEAIPYKRIAWVMERGAMTRLFSKIFFWFALESVGERATKLQLGFQYEPRTLMARVIYPLMMKRKLDKLRKTFLENLKQLAEARA